MNKFIFPLFLISALLLCPQPSLATCGDPWKCGGFKHTDGATDIGDKITTKDGEKLSCSQSNSGYQKVGYGTEAWLAFPYKVRCCDCDGSYDQWMRKPVVCTGVPTSITTLPANSFAVFNSTCWSFACNSGYYGGAGAVSSGICTQCPTADGIYTSSAKTSLARGTNAVGSNLTISTCALTAGTYYDTSGTLTVATNMCHAP
ncbi:MAG: hypothetical protein LBK26_00025 [Rickettsiales bacterium]|nr:hypothetical protein [Rickettsiales bacterium]